MSWSAPSLLAAFVRTCIERFLRLTIWWSPPPLVAELEQVLRRKLKLPRSLVSEVLGFLKQEQHFYEAGSLPAVKIKDRNDVKILFSAQEGEADVFVTGDKELVALGKVEDLRILTPRAFWELLKK